MLGLRSATDSRWAGLALGDLDHLLPDHAHCEKKAAATALAIMAAYPDRGSIVGPLSQLAQEETRHFFQLLAELERRRIPLGRCPPDPYARRLMSWIRSAGEERLADRLLIGAVIEARSCERLGLLAASCADARLAKLFTGLFEAEAQHHSLFSKLAAGVLGPAAARVRLLEFLEAEAVLVAELPLRAAIH